MHRVLTLLALLVCLRTAWPQSLRGTVTDPSGAALPGATVLLRGPGGDHRAKTGGTGQYSFAALKPGRYGVKVTAKDFSPMERKDLAIDGAVVVDFQLAIQADRQVIRVEDGMRRVRPEPGSNGSAVAMGERQIGALSDDPDELALQLEALAGPAPGPDGGQFYVDGFLGNNLPPKSSIREVRINSNPFSPEYDRPGFARIDVFTKPGSDQLRGQAFTQYSDDLFNARNPLLTSSARVPYRAQLSGFSMGGPLKKNRTSFTLDFEHREIHENGLVLATTLDRALNPVKVNEAMATPQSRTSIAPRIDYTIGRRNTLVVRYQDLRIGLDNLGVGDFNLPSRAYNERQGEQLVQVTETAMLNPKAINETRFQYLRASTRDTAPGSTPAILVLGAFNGGGPSTGNSGSINGGFELTNISTYKKGRHTIQFGGRLRRAVVRDTSESDFAGAFTFYSLQQYAATLAGEAGAGPAQFSVNAGSPTTRVSQVDAGIFAGDDWRLRPNLTLSYGLRYEVQTNLGDLSNWDPAWASRGD